MIDRRRGPTHGGSVAGSAVPGFVPPRYAPAPCGRRGRDERIGARTSARVGSPPSSSAYRAWRRGWRVAIRRPRSNGVPVTTTSHSVRVDRLLELANLRLVVAHRRENGADVRIAGERLGDRPDRKRPGIDDLRRARLLGRDRAGSERHAAVRQRRPVLDHEQRARPRDRTSSRVTGDSASTTVTAGLIDLTSSMTRVRPRATRRRPC